MRHPTLFAILLIGCMLYVASAADGAGHHAAHTPAVDKLATARKAALAHKLSDVRHKLSARSPLRPHPVIARQGKHDVDDKPAAAAHPYAIPAVHPKLDAHPHAAKPGTMPTTHPKATAQKHPRFKRSVVHPADPHATVAKAILVKAAVNPKPVQKPAVASKPAVDPTTVNLKPADKPKLAVDPTITMPKPSIDPTTVKPKSAVVPTAVKPKPAIDPTTIKPKPAVDPTTVTPKPADKPKPAVDPTTVKPKPAVDPTTVKPKPAVDPTTVKPKPAMTPAKPKPSNVKQVAINPWDQCGGKSNCQGDGKVCDDKPWPGYVCPAGHTCSRNNDYYYNCQPSGAPVIGVNPQAPPVVTGPVVAPQAQPSVPLKTLADGDYDYGAVLNLSNIFYRIQRSGKLPADEGVYWRKDSGLNDAYQGKPLTGGWYDAGDNVKFNFPMAWTSAVLAWGVYEFPEGFKSTGTYEDTLSNIKWATDYFLKCIVDANTIVGQVGNGNQDHSLWTRPEDIPGPKPVYVLTPSAPGSDLAGAMSAALTSAAMVFKSVDPDYAADLLAGAKTLYTFGTTYKGFYSNSISDAGNFYRSSNYYDDLAWAACWLHIATGEKGYLQDAIKFYDTHWNTENGVMVWNNFDWDSNSWGAVVMLSRLNPSNTFYKSRMDGFIKDWTPATAGPWVKYSPKGLAFTGTWGSLRHTGNGVFLLKAYMNKVNDAATDKIVDCIAHQQLRYIMGDPKLSGRSYVVGFGTSPPQQAHHRAASCPEMPTVCDYNSGFNNPGPNPHVLYGALVGGPDGSDGYQDNRNNFVQNEVACDYNGGFHGALAAMAVAPTKWSQC